MTIQQFFPESGTVLWIRGFLVFVGALLSPATSMAAGFDKNPFFGNAPEEIRRRDARRIIGFFGEV